MIAKFKKLYHRLPRLFTASLITFEVLVLLVLAEAGLRLFDAVYRSEPRLRNENVPPDIYYAGRLGYLFPPGRQLVQHKKRGSNIVMSSRYTIGENALRVTPVDNALPRDRFILTFGCSLTFGIGVEDNETFPYWLGRFAPRYMPYNFGFGGHGPQHMYIRFTEGMVKPNVSQGSGVAIYTFFDDHVRRAVGSMRNYNQWCRTYPCFDLEDGVLQYKGTFDEARPVRNLIYRLLWQSRFVRDFQSLDWPPSSPDVMELTEAFIRESRNAFERLFPGSQFVVLLFPGSSDSFGPKLLPLLKRDSIYCLTLPQLAGTDEWAHRLPDLHPSSDMYRILAQHVVDALHLQ